MGGPQVKEIEQWLSQPWLAVSAMPVASTIIGISRGKAGAVGKVTHPRAPGWLVPLAGFTGVTMRHGRKVQSHTSDSAG
jgi:hypothetical protein